MLHVLVLYRCCISSGACVCLRISRGVVHLSNHSLSCAVRPVRAVLHLAPEADERVALQPLRAIPEIAALGPRVSSIGRHVVKGHLQEDTTWLSRSPLLSCRGRGDRTGIAAAECCLLFFAHSTYTMKRNQQQRTAGSGSRFDTRGAPAI